jgi:uncharacterized protein (TIGR02231 family)
MLGPLHDEARATWPPSFTSSYGRHGIRKAHDMEIALDTTIGEATVYPDRAQIVRRGEVRLEEAGLHTLIVGGLPAALDRESLRATGRGPAGTRILGVEQAAEYHASAPEEALRRVGDEIDRLTRELALVEQRAKTIEDERGWLRDMGQQSARSMAVGMARGTARPEDATAFFTYAAEESQRLAVLGLNLDRQRQDLQRELEARRREYAELGGRKRPDRVAARVRVDMPEPGTFALDLSYHIGGASWSPRYDARVDTTAGQVHLTQQALVRQWTGENWDQVTLALSTARPAAAVSLPDEPPPWYLDVAVPVPPRQPALRRMVMAAPMAAPSEGVAALAYAPDDAIEAAAPPPLATASLAAADVARRAAYPRPGRVRPSLPARLCGGPRDRPRRPPARHRQQHHWPGLAPRRAPCLPHRPGWRRVRRRHPDGSDRRG